MSMAPRASAARAAKQRALDLLRDKPAPDPAAVADRARIEPEVGGQAAKLVAVDDDDRSTVGLEVRRECLGNRGLAGTGGADQEDEIARGDVHIDVAQGEGAVGVPLADVVEPDQSSPSLVLLLHSRAPVRTSDRSRHGDHTGTLRRAQRPGGAN